MLLPQQRVLSAPQLPSHPSMALTLILFCFKKPFLLYLFIFSCSQVPNQESTLCIPEVKAQNLNHKPSRKSFTGMLAIALPLVRLLQSYRAVSMFLESNKADPLLKFCCGSHLTQHEARVLQEPHGPPGLARCPPSPRPIPLRAP